jgi:hypothetical protein
MKLVEMAADKFNLTEGTIISDANKIAEYVKELENGSKIVLANGNKVGKIIIGECMPLGIGIVENPAGQLSPLIVDNKEDIKVVEKSKSSENDINTALELVNKELSLSTENLEKFTKDLHILAKTTETSYECAAKCMISAINNFTNQNLSVKNITKDNQTKKLMDIKSIKDITDENLKECKASAVTDFISQELKKANDKFVAEQESGAKLIKEKEQIEANLKKVQEDLKKLQDIAAAKEAEETYNQRMTYFDDTYELSKEERQVIASEIKDLDKDKFDALKTKYDVFLKEKSKAAIKERQDLEEAEAKKSGKVFDPKTKKWVNKDEVKEEKKEAKASVEDKTIVDDALKNGKEANAKLPNAQGGEQDFMDQFKDAWSPENCVKVKK